MRYRLAEVAAVTGGTLAGPDGQVDGATTDSRRVTPGQLFVPLVAARDGHDFIADALAAGAGGYLSARPPSGDGGVEVADTAAALDALAADARRRLPDRVVGVTGSVGKTTVKDLAGGALATTWPTHASPASYNNEIGVPLTLLNAPEDTGAVVVEMGARRPGDIAHLCRLARPRVGVITAIAPSHLASLGDLDGVAREKGALVEALPADGTAVLNDADCGPALRRRSAAPVLSFGTDRGDVRASLRDLDDELRPRVHFDTPWGAADATLSVRGAHQALNAAGALGAALAAGVALDDAVAGLAAATGSAWRMEVGRAAGGALVLNDAYNANPRSMAAALDSLAAVPARRRVALVGPMEELGPAEAAAHAEVAAQARALGIDLVAVGTDRYGVAPVSPDELAALVDSFGEGDAVLVKASRAAGLEALAGRLRAGEVAR